jgi:hypothetical protein
MTRDQFNEDELLLIELIETNKDLFNSYQTMLWLFTIGHEVIREDLNSEDSIEEVMKNGIKKIIKVNYGEEN